MSVEDDVALARHLRMADRMQGMGYSWNIVREALRLGLNGWVRNRLDGSVEAVACGSSDSVDALVRWAKHGPSMARVDEMEANGVADLALPDGFEQRETV